MLTTSDHEASTAALSAPVLPGSSSTADDRRGANRAAKNVQITLSALGWTERQTCMTDDLSEGGLFVRVPVACGLAVGQRCEVGFGDVADGVGLSSVAGEIRYATVIRTHAVPQDTGDLIGAGLRFDQPLFL